MGYTVTIKGHEIKVETAEEMKVLLERFSNGGPPKGNSVPRSRRAKKRATGVRYGAEARAKVVQLSGEGLGAAAIAHHLKVSVNYVYQIRAREKSRPQVAAPDSQT